MEDLLGSVQLDRWTFRGWNPIAIVSHVHSDHDPTVANCSLRPEKILIHERFFAGLHNPSGISVVSTPSRRGQRIFSNSRGYPFLGRDIEGEFGIDVPAGGLHAAWWIFKKDGVLSIFAGDLNVLDVKVMRDLSEKLEPEIVVLPSYGEIKGGRHGTAYPGELKEKVAMLAETLRNRGIGVWGLPHPVTPEWADRVAQRFC